MIGETRVRQIMQYIYDEFLVDNVDVKYELCEDAYILLQELLDLRKEKAEQKKSWDMLARGHKNAMELIAELDDHIALLIAIANKMAQILSDGEGKADQICCVDFYHARDAVYEYTELLREVKGE